MENCVFLTSRRWSQSEVFVLCQTAAAIEANRPWNDQFSKIPLRPCHVIPYWRRTLQERGCSHSAAPSPARSLTTPAASSHRRPFPKANSRIVRAIASSVAELLFSTRTVTGRASSSLRSRHAAMEDEDPSFEDHSVLNDDVSADLDTALAHLETRKRKGKVNVRDCIVKPGVSLLTYVLPGLHHQSSAGEG